MIIMGAFGSVLGGIMTMVGLFLTIWVTFTITNNMLIFLLFAIFGVLGGISLGALNGRKARLQAKYRNEYLSYGGMTFAAIILMALYYFIFGFDSIRNNSDFSETIVVLIAASSGILIELGLGLVIANSLAEDTTY